jgi:hypothetical protein
MALLKRPAGWLTKYDQRACISARIRARRMSVVTCATVYPTCFMASRLNPALSTMPPTMRSRRTPRLGVMPTAVMASVMAAVIGDCRAASVPAVSSSMGSMVITPTPSAIPDSINRKTSSAVRLGYARMK